MSSKSVREMRREGTMTADGRKVDSSASIPDRKPKGKPTPPRKMADSFRVGDVVSASRTAHGWYRCGLEGRLTSIGLYGATLLDLAGAEHEIERPGDLTLIRRGRR
jgi:hypothetical protein